MSTGPDRGASSPQLLRRANRQALLQHALRVPRFTAADAMAATGLTRATVLGVCSELEQAGWLHEVSVERVDGVVQRGRPARHYALRAEAAVIVGVDAGQHTLMARAVDLRGREMTAASRAIDGDLDGRDVGQGAAAAECRVEAVRDLVDQVIEQAGAGGRRRLLTVVGVPAPVDSAGRSPSVDSTYWPAMNPGLVDALDGTVQVENDANLAALAEHALAAPHARTEHVAALLMGERFGAGLIVDGRLLRGAAGGAGEMRFLDDVLGDSRGADGVAALARRWTLDAIAAGRDSPTLAAFPADVLSAVDVFAAARDGDPLARDVLDRIAARLARIAAILSSLLGVERVVVAGAIADAIEPVLQRSRLELTEIAAAPLPQLVASELGREVVVRGAIEHALTRLRESPLDLLSPEG
ncbi:transcriptional regulator [Brachybacterium avium]|uniref:Transcriptional regulator n=1 Tax=Brachybacterium avium TaxID=2017485 RepID=A0A220UBD5_9MICO|nr:ROK family protein [Brachybacterium avium]ASK65256.1 transcriptional regulator [Brachybacterium avium]